METMVQPLADEISDMNNEEMKRAWEHGLHEDKIFNDRLNFFIVFESILLSFVGSLLGKTTPEAILIILISLGIILTALFGYTQARQKAYLVALRSLHTKVFRNYRYAQEHIGKWPVSGVSLLTYGIPTLVGLIWIVFLFFVIIA